MTEFGQAMRGRFLLEPGTDFLNHGSFGAVPREVFAAANGWRRRVETNPDRFMVGTLEGALRAAAGRLAAFLGASGDDVVFVDNATSGVNAVLRSLQFEPGDEILTTSHVYGAVRQTIAYVAGRSGAVPVEAELPFPAAGDDEMVDAVASRITPRTRLLVVDHIASPTALILPVARLCAMARDRGVPVLVDGAHAPGQIDLAIPGLGADWYVGNCHKWLFAPKGCAFLWARRDRQAALHPLSISHDLGKGFASEFDWTGTRDFASWLAVTAALDFIAGIDAERMRRHNHDLVLQAARRIAAAWRTPVGGRAEQLGAMAAIRLPDSWQPRGLLSRETARRLQSALLSKHRIDVAVTSFAGVLWARISAQIYNAPEDYERLASLPVHAPILEAR